MSKKDEALKLALEALEKIYIAPEHEEYIRVWWPACEQAITALREALAEQPAQRELNESDDLTIAYMAGVHRGKELAKQPSTEDSSAVEQPAQQEPVKSGEGASATVTITLPAQQGPVAWLKVIETPGGWGKFVEAKPHEKGAKPVYTSPPAQRTWVGLTEEDENKLLEAVIGSLPVAKNLIRAIEAKLREKNT